MQANTCNREPTSRRGREKKTSKKKTIKSKQMEAEDEDARRRYDANKASITKITNASN